MKFKNTCIRKNPDTDLLSKCIIFLENNSEETLKKSRVFSLLGNEVRLKIIMIFLNFDNLCVCDLSDILGIAQSAVSQHLRKLKDGGLLQNKRKGMTIFYSICKEKKEQLKKILEG
ncbi:MAG: metalloregulator ArsR/SmtB family transcription factor [Campylobacteraceae bacterium]|nr:metalloregulator ArsR/SmtB family transcription factor [Campylobacteraceae bacterium]